MKKTFNKTILLLRLLIIALAASTVTSCGSIRTFGGIEHEYSYDFDGHGYHHKKPKKPKKPKKHKKHHDHDD